MTLEPLLDTKFSLFFQFYVQLVDIFQKKGHDNYLNEVLLLSKTLLLISILVSEIFIIVKILDDLVKAAKQCGKILHTIDISGVDPRLRDSVSYSNLKTHIIKIIFDFFGRLKPSRCSCCRTSPNFRFFPCTVLTRRFCMR
jgi:hypothetical protein